MCVRVVVRVCLFAPDCLCCVCVWIVSVWLFVQLCAPSIAPLQVVTSATHMPLRALPVPVTCVWTRLTAPPTPTHIVHVPARARPPDAGSVGVAIPGVACALTKTTAGEFVSRLRVWAPHARREKWSTCQHMVTGGSTDAYTPTAVCVYDSPHGLRIAAVGETVVLPRPPLPPLHVVGLLSELARGRDENGLDTPAGSVGSSGWRRRDSVDSRDHYHHRHPRAHSRR